jgi:ketosteroid isomerase-like protein
MTRHVELAAGMVLIQVLLVLGFTLSRPAYGSSSDDLAIRLVMKNIEDASNQRDSKRILGSATNNIVMVSKNGDIVVGRAALENYLNKMFGMAPSLKGLHSRVFLTEPNVINGRTALANGTSEDEYVFADGMRLKITTLWSATLILIDGEWKIARVHFSFNLFDNPLLAGAKVFFNVALIVGALIGIASWAVLLWYFRRLKRVA